MGQSLFLALCPEAADAERLAAVATQEHLVRGLAPRLRPSRLLHITLHFFGRWEAAPEPAVIERAQRAAARVRSATPRIDFERFESWGGSGAHQHPFVLTADAGLDEVRALQRELAHQLALEGIATPGDFKPHLTLRYDRHPAPVWVLELPGWRAQEMRLLVSHQGQSRHEVVGRWPLQA